MNKNQIRKRLSGAFPAPPPRERDAFLSRADFPRLGLPGFALAQARYIRKRVWAASLLSVIVSPLILAGAERGDALNSIWIISSLLPFAALVSVTEITRGASQKMRELEMSCKYGLNAAVLARMGWLGAVNALLSLIVPLILSSAGGWGFFRMFTYLFTPFLLTCVLSLFAQNRLRPADGVYSCGLTALIVSVLNGLFHSNITDFFTEHFTSGAALFAALLVWMVFEIYKFLKQTEELQWNSSLTA